MTWFDELRTSALVGTVRHEAPAPPPELGVLAPVGLSREEFLLDQAAMADVVRRSSRTASMPTDAFRITPAPVDSKTEATGEAARLLELLLHQPPVGLGLRNQLVADWLFLAAESRRRVPHRQLPALFLLAANDAAVYRALNPAIGTRGLWLQDVSPSWSPRSGPAQDNGGSGTGTAPGPAEPDATAREQLTSDWSSLSARARLSLLKIVGTGVRPDDEDLLERGLDDKAKGVREMAAELLNQLPRSARARRMGARLAPLLTVKGLLNKRFDIDLPPDPDAATLRDGIAPVPRNGEPDRLARLDTIILGAPLDVWITASGKSAEATASMLKEEPRILAVLATVAAGRNNLEWVRALLTVSSDARLLHCLPVAERERWLERHIRHGVDEPLSLASLLRELPQPWSGSLAEAVLKIIAGKDGGRLASVLADVLPTALPAESTQACRRLLDRTDDDTARRRVLRDAVQYQSFKQSLTEAFR
ncbi:DUF5691 domain-containing protein [Paenarthrobacter histidinolovorans]|uniref:DUF5691 domain-containing protein n=1 Tax=Paenarthrobacter histidinolovorans TaxID=43664 RepID=UPI00166D3885|nr:DUF5691 domain-containing protein [Paenarthrobacter histidinolovorans]GGJ24109.1 hypothetical protein GCM10010052_21540 [Paenarthrobacter histidinolovorans]